MTGETNQPELAELFSDTLGVEPGVARSQPTARRPRTGWRRAVTAGAATIAVVGGLLPLYGDPRVTPLTHPLWARMLLQALEMDTAVETSDQASKVFAALAFKESLTLPAPSYTRGEGVEVQGEEVRAVGRVGEVDFPLVVVRGGDYRMRCHVTGQPGTPVTAEIAPMKGSALAAFQVVPGPEGGWAGAGKLHLDPGTYTASVLLPTGAALQFVEVSPPCVQVIEPPEGWAPRKVTSRADLAVTALQALDAEHELPPAAVPIVLKSSDVQVEGAGLQNASTGPDGVSIEGLKLEGGGDGQRAVGMIEVPEAGLYSLYAFSTPGRGITMLADGCHKAVVCPGSGDGLAWRPILTQRFEAGKHHVDVVLAPGAVVEGLRLELKKSSVADYVATLRALGFDSGPEGDASASTAAEAVRFIRDKRRQDPRLSCGDPGFAPPPLPSVPALVAGAVAGVSTGSEVTLPSGSVPPPPAVEPQEPASPVVPIGR